MSTPEAHASALATGGGDPARPAAGARARVGAPFPLSDMQRIVWLAQALAPDSPAYNVALALELGVSPATEPLRLALRELAARHPVLRTVFTAGEPIPAQVVQATGDVPLELERCGAEELPGRMREACARPFDLARGPLLRATLFAAGDAGRTLLLVGHHIAVDLRSLEVVLADLAELYAAELSCRPSRLPPIAADYAEFVASQQELLESAEGERLARYWADRLSGAKGLLDLPVDLRRRPIQQLRGASHAFSLPAGLTAGLRRLAQREAKTLYATMLTAFHVVLHRYCGDTDVVVGSPVSYRTPRFENTVGCMINFLPVRARVRPRSAFAEILDEVSLDALDALAHAAFPFGQITSRARIDRSAGRPVLAQVGFALDRVRTSRSGRPDPALPMKVLPFLEQQEGQFELFLEVADLGDGLAAVLRYDTGLFSPGLAARLADAYRLVLEQIVEDPRRPVGALDVIGAAERRRLVVDLNATAEDLPRHLPVHEAIEQQCRRSPARPAAAAAGRSWTYAELDARAAAIAAALAAQGMVVEDAVAVAADRDFDLLAAMLGIFEAGGVYLPLDPHHPPARWAQALSQAGVAVVLASDATAAAAREAAAAAAPPGRAPRVVRLADALRADPRAAPPRPAVSERHLAYTIFTSGSTGRPKGAMVHHGGMANHVWAKARSLGITERDVVAQTASQCFDISLWQCLSALVVGGRVEFFSDEEVRDPALLLAEARRRGVTVLEVVPSFLRALLDELDRVPDRLVPSLRTLVATGEALPPGLVQRWLARAPHVPIVNAYGPTECADDVAQHVVRDGASLHGDRVPIGRPIANTRLYVVDGALDVVPVGVVGELYVGGAGVGRGYAADPARTAAVFLPDPYSPEPGARMYRTGDLARVLPAGDLEYLGRIDHQVKVQGFRVELGEIEAVLRLAPAVGDAVVDVRAHGGGHDVLVAYVTPTEARVSPDAEALRRHLASRLPAYMVPSAFVRLDRMPLTANGKVDRRALPDPSWTTGRTAAAQAPRGRTEQLVAAAWREILGVDVGVHDNFFELGGDSVALARMLVRVRAAGLRASWRQALLNPTVEAFARAIDGEPARDGATAPPAENAETADGRPPPREALEVGAGEEPGEPYPLTPMQEGILFHCLYGRERDLYLLQARVELSGELSQPDLVRAWTETVRAHLTLHSAVRIEGGGRPVAVASPHAGPVVERIDWTREGDVERRAKLVALLRADRERGLDLAVAPLHRLTLIQDAADRHEAILTFHHLVLDGWSLVLVIRELLDRYRRIRSGEPPPSARAPSFGVFAAWLAAQDLGPAEPFWRRYLEGSEDPLAALAPVPRAAGAPVEQRECSIALTREETDAVKRLARSTGVTPCAVVTAAWAAALGALTLRSDVVFGTSMAGRSADLPEVDAMVGVLLNTLPFRVRIDPQQAVGAFVRHVHQLQAEIQAFEHTPLARIKQWLGTPAPQPLFESNFVFENMPIDTALDGPAAGVRVTNVRMHERGNHALTAVCVPADRMTLSLSYADDRLAPEAARHLAERWRRALQRFADHPDASVREASELNLPQGTAVASATGAEDDGRRFEPKALRNRAPFEAPRGGVEALIADVWEEILRVDRVGRSDAFFDLGGDSILAMRVVGRLNELLRTALPVRVVFEHPRLDALADAIVGADGGHARLTRIAEVQRKVLAMSETEVRDALRVYGASSTDDQPLGDTAEVENP